MAIWNLGNVANTSCLYRKPKACDEIVKISWLLKDFRLEQFDWDKHIVSYAVDLGI